MRRLFALFVFLFISSNLHADTSGTLDTSKNYNAIGKFVVYLTETSKPLTLQQAQTAYNSGIFSKWNSPVLGFGIGTSPVWLHFTVTNKDTEVATRRLIIENSWLDHADVFIIKDNKIISHEAQGDSQPFADRAIHIASLFSNTTTRLVSAKCIFARPLRPHACYLSFFV